MMDNTNYLEKVQQWHKTFKQPIAKQIMFPPHGRFKMRHELLLEECRELAEAYHNGDVVEVADAFADIMYVLAGTIIEFGMQEKFNAIFDEVHRSNMSKLGEDGKPVLRSDGKVLKGKFFSEPNLKKIIYEQTGNQTKL